MMDMIENTIDHTFMSWLLYIIAAICFGLGTIIHIFVEFTEAKHRGCRRYFRDIMNIYQWIMILINASLIMQILINTGNLKNSYVDKYGDDDMKKSFRINMVLCLILNMVELSTRIRIFNFFAYFVR